MTRELCSDCGGRHLVEEACNHEPDRTGELVGRYRITRRLGSGGMGVVYEARHRELDRRFAIKFLRAELTRREATRRRFVREARAAAALEHENVVGAIDLGEGADGTPYLVMEYLEGEDLGRLLERTGALSAPRAAGIIVQACRGLAIAHARKILHRDLKPANLFISRRGDGTDHVRVLDFGVAKVTSPELGDDGKVTGDGQVPGTPAYMSPEQARGLSSLDESTDVYALGAILFELLSGQRAHPGSTRNEVLYHVLTQPITPLSELRPNLPDGLADVVAAALSAEPAARFATVAAFGAKLEPYLASRLHSESPPREARVPTSAETTADSDDPRAVTAPPLTERKPRGRREIATATAVSALLLLLFGGGALYREHAQTRHRSGLRAGLWSAVARHSLPAAPRPPNPQSPPATATAKAEGEPQTSAPPHERPLPLPRLARRRRADVENEAQHGSMAHGDETPTGSLTAEIYKP